MADPNKACIGLFGTCDKVRWRDPFMSKYADIGISFFNPMVDDWHPGMAALEAEHLANDPVVLFPILKESYALGSLAEMGFGPLKAIRQNRFRSFVVLIDDEVTPELAAADPLRAKASKTARALVKAHLKDLGLPNVYLVDTLEQMLELSVKLHAIHTQVQELEAFTA